MGGGEIKVPSGNVCHILSLNILLVLHPMFHDIFGLVLLIYFIWF